MRLLATFIMSVLLAWPARAQIEPWKQVGGWDVNVDRSLKNSCFILFKGTRGTVVRLGFTAERDMHWFLAHDDWKSLEEGKAYVTSVSFDNGAPYTGPMKGKAMGGGVVALSATFADATVWKRFLGEFMRGNRMRVTYGGQQIALLNLQNSAAAGEALLACQTSFDGKAPGSGPPAGGDPFAPRGGQPPDQKDPFKR